MICLFRGEIFVFQTTGSYYTLTKMPVKGKFHQYPKLVDIAFSLSLLTLPEIKYRSMI